MMNGYNCFSADFEDFFDIKNSDMKCNIFYDESNNYGRVYLCNGKLNIPNDYNFLLGGVMCFDEQTNISLDEIKKKFNICNDIKELKSKNFFDGDFLKALSSKKLNRF